MAVILLILWSAYVWVVWNRLSEFEAVDRLRAVSKWPELYAGKGPMRFGPYAVYCFLSPVWEPMVDAMAAGTIPRSRFVARATAWMFTYNFPAAGQPRRGARAANGRLGGDKCE